MIRRLALLLILAGPAMAAVVYVQAGASGSGDGSSWANACPTLQAGLALATSGDQVWISQGTYKPGTLRTSTFTIPNGVAVYGGFVGTETLLGQRRDDPTLVVLSGEIGAAGYGDNIKRLVTMTGSGRLDTVTVTLANYDDTTTDDGAGLVALASGAEVAVVRCRITQNRAYGPVVVVIKNAATALIDRCEISYNSEITFRSRIGGTVWFNNCQDATISNSAVIAANPASTGDILGAVEFEQCNRGLASNCVFANCRTVAALYFFNGNLAAMRSEGCVFVGNRATNQSAGSARGCIFEPSSYGQTFTPTGVGVSESNWITSVNGDPKFVNRAALAGADGIWFTADDGLGLQADSPCREQARFTTSTTLEGMPRSDILGLARPQGRHPDCGAYEYPTGNTGPAATARTVQVNEDLLSPISLTGTDADGDALTALVLSLPATGSLYPTADGITAAGPALAAGDLPYAVNNPGVNILFQPVTNLFGTSYASFTFAVDDGQVPSDAATLTIDVLSVNDAPTITARPDLAVFEDSGQTLVELPGLSAGTPALAVGDPSREVQVLAISATSSDPAIVPDPTISYTSPNPTASLAFAPAAHANGTVTITVTVHDDGGGANGGIDTTVTTFTVSVQPVNDPPRMAPIADVVMPEDCSDAALTTVTITGVATGPANESAQALSINVLSSNPAVISAGAVDYSQGSPTAQIHLVPTADAHGSALIFVSFRDDGGTGNGGENSSVRVFQVTVDPVADPPILAVNSGLLAITGQTTTLGADRLRLTDADLAPAAALVYTLATTPASGALRLSGTDLAAGATFTQADVDGGLLAYAHAGGAMADDVCTITWTDGSTPVQGPASIVITLTGSALPVISLPGPGDAWTEGTPPSAVAPGALVSDADPQAWDHGNIIATLVAGDDPDDVLSLEHAGFGAGEVGVAGSALTFGGQAIGSWSGGTGGVPLLVTFSTAAATPTAAQAVVRRLRFSNAGGNPGNALRSVRVVVNDGAAGASIPAETTVAVIPVDNPPTLAGPWVATVAGLTRDFRLAAIDPDSASLVWSLVSQPSAGVLSLVDAATGTFRIQPGGIGSTSAQIAVADATSTTIATLTILVADGDGAQPLPASDPPREAFISIRLDADLVFDVSGLTGPGALEFAVTGTPPDGLSVSPLDPVSARLSWPVPSGTAGTLLEFGVLAIDPVSRLSGHLPVRLRLHPQPGAAQ